MLIDTRIESNFFLTVNYTEYRAELNEHFVSIVRLSGRFHIKSNCWFERMNQRMKTKVCMAAWKPATCSQQLMCVEYPHNTNWTQSFVCTYGFQGGSSKPSSVVTVKQVLPEVIQLLHLRMLWSLNKNLPVATQLEHISFSHSHCLGFMIRINDFFLLWTI